MTIHLYMILLVSTLSKIASPRLSKGLFLDQLGSLLNALSKHTLIELACSSL